MKSHSRPPVRRRAPGRWLAAVLATAIAVLAGGCDAAAPAPSLDAPTSNPNAGAIRIAASSSLAEAFIALKAPFEAANPGTRVVFTFGAAPTLVGQVQVGGFDVFAADDLGLARAVVTNRKAAGPAQAFARDPIVLVVPAANPARITGPLDLGRPGVRIATSAVDAPLTAYAAQVVKELAGLPGYAADYPAAIASNAKPSQDDARATLARVENGEADAAFVYASDAQASTKVTVLPLPDGAKVSAIFGVVILAAAVDPIAAAAFARWLTTAAGQKTLMEHGFEPPGST